MSSWTYVSGAQGASAMNLHDITQEENVGCIWEKESSALSSEEFQDLEFV